MAESSSFIIYKDRICSLSRRFAFVNNGANVHDSLFPVYPNEELLSIPLIQGELKFVWKKASNIQQANYHITLAMDDVFYNHLALYKQALCIYLSEKSVSLALWQNEKHQLMHVYQFDTAEDLLFLASKIASEFNLDKETDPVLFSGSVTEDSRIFQLFKIYFRNVLLKQNTFPETL